MRVRIINDHKNYEEGKVYEVTPNIAHGLVDSGYAILSKDVTPREYKKKKVNRGKSTRIRTNFKS